MMAEYGRFLRKTVDNYSNYGIIPWNMDKCDEETNRFGAFSEQGMVEALRIDPPEATSEQPARAGRGFPVTGQMSDALAGCHQGGTVEQLASPLIAAGLFLFCKKFVYKTIGG